MMRLTQVSCELLKPAVHTGDKLNSTRSTLLEVDKVDRVALAPYTHWQHSRPYIGNKVERIGNKVDREKISFV